MKASAVRSRGRMSSYECAPKPMAPASTTTSRPMRTARPRNVRRSRSATAHLLAAAHAVQEDRDERLRDLFGTGAVDVALLEDLPDDHVVDDHAEEGARRERRVERAEGALAATPLDVAGHELAQAPDAALEERRRELVVLEARVEQDAQEGRVGVDARQEAAGEPAEDRAVVARARGLFERGDRIGRGDLLVDDRLVERFLAREV